MATSPLPSWGPTSSQNCYVTPAFSGVPRRGDKIKNGHLTPAFLGPTSRRNCYVGPAFCGVPRRGAKIKSGYLTPAFSVAHKWAALLCNPCVLGGHEKRGQNQNCPPHPCLLGGPQVDGRGDHGGFVKICPATHQCRPHQGFNVSIPEIMGLTGRASKIAQCSPLYIRLLVPATPRVSYSSSCVSCHILCVPSSPSSYHCILYVCRLKCYAHVLSCRVAVSGRTNTLYRGTEKALVSLAMC